MTVPPQVPLCAIRQPAFLYGSDGRVAEANDLAEALAGRSLAGCSTAAVVGIFDVCLPDGTPLLPADLPAARALRGEETVDAPLLIKAADDRTMHILATASPIRDGSGTVGALAVWQDVSFLEAALADQARLRLESEARGEELKTQEEELRRQRDELLRAGAENARQRHLLDTILGTIPYRVSLWSRDERLLWANERFAAERGLSRDRLIGRPYKEFGDREAVVGSLVDEARSAATDGIPVRRELVIPAPDGPGWRACTLLPFLEDALLVITEDITERRRGMEERERLLAESEEHRGRLQAIVESLPVGLWIADATGKMLFINDRAREIWGGDAPYATSVEGYGAYTAWWADTGERIAAEEMPVARALRGESSRELVIDFLRFDGTHGTQLVSAEPIRTADGTIIGGVAIVQDITERRRIKTALAESEAKYRNLVELAPDAIVILQDGAIVFANPAAAALVGAAAPEELVGRSALDLVPSTSRDRFAATMQADLRDGTSPTELTDLVRLDGTTVPVQGRGARLLFRGRPALQVVLRDISDLQRTERALLEREAWLQLAQEAAHVAVWDWDVRTDALRYSPEFLRFFGLDEDTLGEYRAWQEWVHPDDLAGWEAVRDTALANGEPFRGEFRVVHPSGEVRWLAAQGRGVYDDRGDLVHVVGVNIEITDRKQAAVELERLTRRVEVERDRLAAIFDAIPDAVATHDRDGRYVYVNPALTGSIHADPGDFIGRTWAELGLDLERVALLVEAVEGAFASGEPQTGVYDYPIDGVLRTYHALAVPLRGAGGAVDQVIVSSRDITGIREAEKALQRYAADLESEIASRKQAEQAARMREQTLQTLLRAAPVGIGISEDRTIRRVNDYLCRMTGYAPEELVGRDARLLYTSDEEYVRVGEERVMQFLEHGMGVLETQWRRKDGTVIDIMFCSAPMDAASPRGAVVFVGLEITALREKEKALREYAENLERSNQDLERFAYVSSHDLQEPLRPMVSFSQLLQRRYRGRLDADADEYLDFIVEGGVRMQSLIQDLLAYSRVNTTKPAMAPTDPAAVLASVERSLAVPLCEAGATITYDPMPMVLADPLQLEQVFANLISNAIKFRRPDEPLRIHVGARRTDGSCEFSVADNGIGIEEEYFEKIFVIFQRLHTKDAYPGTGIGLAIVKRIIDRHGGRVWLESVPGEGSAFFFTLPAA